MKNTFNLINQKSKAALVLGALTVTAALGLSSTADAAPRRGPDRERSSRARDNRVRNNKEVFRGVVTNDRGANLFNMRVGGTTYNVYTVNRITRRLNQGDVVRVTGNRVGGNDIRDARVSIVRNR